MSDPMFVKTRSWVTDVMQPKLKIKKKKAPVDEDGSPGPASVRASKMSKHAEPKKLPGQDKVFAKKPIFKDHFHQIIPTQSQ